PDVGRRDPVVRRQRGAVGASASQPPAGVVDARTSDSDLPAVRRDRARRGRLPVVHRRPRAGRCVSPDRRGPQMITWPFDWPVYAGLALLLFGHAWLAREASDAQPRHTVYLLAGLATLWIALESPIDTMSDRYLDSVHMLQHVLLGFVAPPLLLLGLSHDMAARLAAVPFVRAATEPVAAQVIAGTVMVVWHVPALYDSPLLSET